MLIAYTAILVLACVPIYCGSFAALRRPKTAPKSESDRDDDDDALSLTERLSSSDALFLPLIGGCVLGSMYLLITYISKEWVNTILGLYFVVMGLASNTQTLSKVLTYTFPSARYLPTYRFTIKNTGTSRTDANMVRVPISILYIICSIGAIGLGAYYAWSKNWIISNFFGLSFAFNGIQLLALDSFQTGMILLSGLFLYDIYFVFGTNIMLTVAQGIEAPIKVLFPRDLLHDPFGPATMLGLGDIVIPGVYVALALRYDLSTHHRNYERATYHKSNYFFDKPYFEAAMLSYICGLILTIVVMHTWRTAQPALLYLSPACILSTLITAWRRGELKEMWSYTEEPDEEARSDEKQKKV